MADRTHGMSSTREYKVWKTIKDRCYGINSDCYDRYGGRGIVMQYNWINNYIEYYNYASKIDGFSDPNKSIDRIDSNGNYEEGNIKFSTPSQQCANRRLFKNSKSGYTGVVKKGKKYEATISVNGKRIYIGRHKDPKVLAIMRDEYIIKNNLTEYPLQILNR